MQYPIYSRVDASPNGPILTESFDFDFAEIPDGNIVIDGKVYGVYTLDSRLQLRLTRGSEYGWVKVYGQSMNASSPISIDDGDYILFIKDQKLNHGEIVIASLPDETGAGYRFVVKRCVIDTRFSYEAILMSESTESHHKPLKPNKDAIIIGKAVAVAKLNLDKVFKEEL